MEDTIKDLTDLQKLAVVGKYINGLLEQQQQLEANNKRINDYTERLAKLNNLKTVLQQKGNPSLDEKYGMNPETKLGKRIQYIIDNVNNNGDTLSYIRMWLVVSVLFGVYEYFSKNKASLPRNIVNCELVILESKVAILKKALSEKEILDFMDFYNYRFGPKWDELKELLPDSIYTSLRLRNIYDHSGYSGKKKKRFEYFDSWLSYVFDNSSLIETDGDFKEIQKFIESMIEVFIEYCPPIAIKAYLAYATYAISNELGRLKESNDKNEESLHSAIPQAAGWLPQALIEKAYPKNK